MGALEYVHRLFIVLNSGRSRTSTRGAPEENKCTRSAQNFGPHPHSLVTRPLLCRELANSAAAVNVC